MMAKRISDAEWRGDLKDGAGTLKLASLTWPIRPMVWQFSPGK